MCTPRLEGRLLEWSLGTFHTGFFFTILVTLLYVTGALGSLLAGLNTAFGLATFALLWLTTWWCTRRALGGFNGVKGQAYADFTGMLVRATIWGGINAVLFLIGPIAIAAVISSVSPGGGNFDNLPALLRVLLIELVIAFGAGMVFGLLLGLIDAVLFKVSRRILLRLHTPYAR